ncbi:MAG: sigma-54-dependent transcriptional regulator [Terriglobia bacterium]
MLTNERILVVDDDERIRTALENLLRGWGYDLDVAVDGLRGWEKIVSGSPAVVLSDLKMPGLNGLELLRQTRNFKPEIFFIMLSGQGSIQSAVEATRLGAFDFLEKPVDPRRLQIVLRKCLDRRESERQLQVAHRKLGNEGSRGNRGALGKLVGRSKKMQEIVSIITMAAPSSASVLISGESGSGKEVAARTIHELSPRRSQPFVAVNCAAIPDTLVESELFGHEKGAFTGALQSRVGCLQLADGGTLLLDEIGEMPAAGQAKLLRVLEDSRVRRLGAKSEVTISARVLASTNRNLDDAVKAGRLRKDLFYRLNVFHISMPPLREHLEDLELLANALLEEIRQKHNYPAKSISAEALGLMHCYTWPGNVRELRNVLERAMLSCAADTITPKDIPAAVRGDRGSRLLDASRIAVGLSIEEAERRLILQTLSSTNNNKSRAADILGISTRTLANKLKEYDCTPVN